MTGRAFDHALRVGDADRDGCIERLQVHFATGTLERYEFEERVEKALGRELEASSMRWTLIAGIHQDLVARRCRSGLRPAWPPWR